MFRTKQQSVLSIILAKWFNERVYYKEEMNASNKLDPLDVIYVGRLTKAKKPLILLKAFTMLSEILPEGAKLIIVGEGPEKNKIEALIHQKKLTNEITLVGYISNPLNLIEESDLFVLSSSQEGFGMVIVEALSLGKTVVSTDCHSGPSEIIGDNEFGYLCKVDDPSDLAEKIDYARKNIMNPEKLINRSKEFTLEKIGPLYEEILDTLN